jgi:hypothetical protein
MAGRKVVLCHHRKVNSVLYDLIIGKVQGFIFGPVLYASFISLLFNLNFIVAFADDNFIRKTHNSLPQPPAEKGNGKCTGGHHKNG